VQYIYRDLGQRRRGDVVQFNLSGNQANIALLDPSNYSAFRNGRSFRGVARLALGSPVRLAIPNTGHWYAVIYIPPGYTGRVNGSISVIPASTPLPGIRPSSPSPLGSIRRAADEYAESLGVEPEDKEYDVFISHAGEDKAEVVRPLAEALRERGLDVWYDEFELRIGDSLRRKIDQGIRSSRFGVVVLSPSFFGKGWPEYELDGLVTIGVTSGRSVVLPVWHKVTRADVAGYSPSLAGLLARSTADVTIEALAAEIASVAQPAVEAV
jgi:hypothetical protein